MTPEEIAKIFEEMEDYLFQSMARTLKKHEAWEFEEGFEWVQWQAEQINGLREFREEIQDIVNHTYDSALPHMEQLLTDAYRNGELRAETDISRARGVPAQQTFFGTTPKMRGLVENVLFDINRTRYACINRMNSGYTSILQKADLYAQSGTMTIPQAVDMASKDFVSAGINCVEYSNGARVGIDSYCEMALRTSSRDASALGEGSRRDAWEEHLVVSNVINTTCPHCLKWQGKVLVDDVYANGKKDGKHPLLSKAKEEGFLHPNCRHKPYTYFEGITKLPSQPEKAKTLEQYKAEQKQRYYERNIRKYKRLRDCALDDENKAKYDAKVKEWSRALDKHLGANTNLRKSIWRESKRGNGFFDGDKVSASRYLNSSDKLYYNASKVKPLEGYQDFVCHSDEFGFEFRDADGKVIRQCTPSEFADMIKKDETYTGGKVRLLCCRAGAEGGISAQVVANKLGVDVLAPSDTLWIDRFGVMNIGKRKFDNDGTWILFKPQKGGS